MNGGDSLEGISVQHMGYRSTFGFVKKLIISCLVIATCGIISLYFFYLVPRRVTPILMYHSISDNGRSSLCVSPTNFRKQMRFLHEQGYSVISLGRLVGEVRKGRRFLPRTVVITFDDGFEDNFRNAYPVLVEYNMPATVFLITGYVSRKEGYLKWDQVALMSKSGISPGGHTRNNVYLPALSSEKALEEEIAGCKKDIEDKLGVKVQHFAYPLGGFTDKIKDIVRSSGYTAACTTNRGVCRTNQDVYELKRIKVTNSDMTKLLHFRAKLSGFYNAFRSIKKGG